VEGDFAGYVPRKVSKSQERGFEAFTRGEEAIRIRGLTGREISQN